jgi:hypothetical protein
MGSSPFTYRLDSAGGPPRRETSPSLDDLASPVLLNCVECGASIILTNRATLRRSDVRHQTLKLIHHGSVVVADGRIERDPSNACLPGAQEGQP